MIQINSTGEVNENTIGPDPWTQIIGENPWKKQWEKQREEIQNNTENSSSTEIFLYISLGCYICAILIGLSLLIKKYKSRKS